MGNNASEASLILGSGEQLSLIDGAEMDEAGVPGAAYADAEARGRFTGERLFLSNPKLYQAVARLLARGETYREIADICQVSTQTVTGVAFREKIPVETLRERLGRVGLDVSRLSLEAMLEILSDPVSRAKLTLKDLAIAHGIATTNSQLLLGGATVRVETREVPSPGHDDYQRMLAEAAAEAQRREINVTGTVQTGLQAGTLETKGAALPAPAEGGDRANLAAQAAPSSPLSPPAI